MKRHRVLGAILIAVLLHICGALLIEGYSSPFSIRAMLVLAALLGVVIGFANVVAAQLTGQGVPFWVVAAVVGVLALLIGGSTARSSRSSRPIR